MRKTQHQDMQEYSHVEVQGRHLVVTDAIKDYVMVKIAKIDRFSARLIDAVIHLEVQKGEHRCSIILRFDTMKIKVEADSHDLYVSIDKAMDRLKVQVRRYKEKLVDHHKRPSSDLSVLVFKSADDAEIINDDIEDENERRKLEAYSPHQVVKHDKIPLKILTMSEAMVKMDLSKDPFLIYRSEEEQRIKVIYRRDDGQYGIITPDA